MTDQPPKSAADYIHERMPEILPRIREILDEAEAKGLETPKEIDKLRVKADEIERRLAAEGLLPPSAD